MEEAAADGAGGTKVERAVREVQATRAGVGAGKGELTRADLGDRAREGDGAGEGQRGTVGTRADDLPGLRTSGDERSRDGNDARIRVDGDAVGGATRGERQGTRGTLGDGNRGHTGDSIEDEAVDGEVAIEGQALGAGRDIAGTEHEGVGEGRQRGGVGAATDIGGPVGVARIVREERVALVAIEEGVGDLARLDTEDRAAARGRDLVVEGRRRVTENPRGAGEAAAGVSD